MAKLGSYSIVSSLALSDAGSSELAEKSAKAFQTNPIQFPQNAF
jgi:hypothetical protein